MPIQAQIQHFMAVNSNTCSIYELLDCKEAVMHNQIWEHIIVTEDENLKHGCDRNGIVHPAAGPRSSFEELERTMEVL